MNLLATIVLLLDTFPFMINFPSIEQLAILNSSKENVGGTESPLVQFLTSPFFMASSVKAGLRAVSSSVGIPAISSELLSLAEVYVIEVFNPESSHLYFPCKDSPLDGSATSLSRVHLISFASSSIPSFPIRLIFNLTVSPLVSGFVVNNNKKKDILPGLKVKVFICLKEINNWAFFSASSLVIGLSSSQYSVIFPPVVVWVISLSSSSSFSSSSFSSSSFSSSFSSSSFSSSFSLPSVVMGSVWNEGKTNSSTPPTTIEVCSIIKGLFWTFPSILQLMVTVLSCIFVIVHINITPLGKAKGILNFWPFFKLSVFSILIVMSKIPLSSTFSKFFLEISTNGGIIVTFEKSGKRPFDIASSVNFGFNKVLLVGKPATDSEEINWMESKPVKSLFLNSHLKGAGAIFSVPNSTAASTLQIHSCFCGSFVGPFIR